ncbi:MAG: helix-turn-helix domain-containing protein [Clostridia bacterium]|nr:helix-turn-helix domain-containing protein [Clostridia bacterium]
MEDLKLIISRNIAELRRSKGITQTELAERLNYTDKAISKWERGESIPDAVVLKQLADIFGVSIDYLFAEDHKSFFSKPGSSISRLRRRIMNRKFILAICIVLVWLIATLVFIILHSTIRSKFDILCFAYALPASFIVWLVLNSVWFSKRRNFLIISLLMWTLLLAFCYTMYLAGIPVWYVMILGIPGQAIIYFWSRIRLFGSLRRLAKLKNKAESENTVSEQASISSDTAQ